MMDTGMQWRVTNASQAGTVVANRTHIIHPAAVASVMRAKANRTYNHLYYNCQDVAFDFWKGCLPQDVSSVAADVLTPLQIKSRTASADGGVLLLLFLLVRTVWKSYKTEQHG